MQVAMTYLRVLREAHDLSQEDVARATNVTVKQIGRWERGESEPGVVGLAAFVQLVQGSMEDVKRLILDQKADENAALRAAETILHFINQVPDERDARRQRAIALIDDLLADPQKMDRLLGYGARLQEE